MLRPNKINKISKESFFSSSELDDIGLFFHTDKSRLHHDYLRKYEFFFHPWRNKEFRLMELGVYRGESIRTWEKYFSQAKIVGIDVEKVCENCASDRCEIVITDLAKEENLKQLMRWKPSIIIDDASHMWSHQIKALFILWNVLPHGGIYIVEDIETSFPESGFVGYDDAIISTFDICAAIAKVSAGGCHLHGLNLFSAEIENIGQNVEMISFIEGSCIMVKK